MLRNIVVVAVVGYLINTNGFSMDMVSSFFETMTKTSPEYIIRYIVDILAH